MPDQATPRYLESLPVHGLGPQTPTPHIVVSGLVARPLTLTPAELEALPSADVTDDFVCRESWCVPGLHWRGVALATLLEAAGADESATWIEVASGSFATSLPREEALRGLLATHLGDAVLAPEHGGPIRLVVPGADCCTSIKWVDRIAVLARPSRDRAREIALARIERAAGSATEDASASAAQ